MHSIHVHTSAHQQQQQQQQLQHQELLDQNNSRQQQHLHQNEINNIITTDQQQTTMTVLSSLDPNQQLISDHHRNVETTTASLSLLDDNNQSGHIIQAQEQPPLLHQLQPILHVHTPSSHSFESGGANTLSHQQLFTTTATLNNNNQSNTSDSHNQHLHQHHPLQALEQQEHRSSMNSNENGTQSLNNNPTTTTTTTTPTTPTITNNTAGLLKQQQRSQQEAVGLIAPLHDGGGPIVRWLREKYEIAEGESLPRSTVYNHYLSYCRQLEMASVNAASFGKLIRSVFVGLKTRRLGTRGHSKYHYFGVREKQHSSRQQELSQHEMLSSTLANNENSNQNITDNGSETTNDSLNGRNSASTATLTTDGGGRLSTGSGGGGGGAIKRARRGSSTSGAVVVSAGGSNDGGSVGIGQSIHNHQQQHQHLHQQQQHQQQQQHIYDIHQNNYTDNINNVVYYSNNAVVTTNGYDQQNSLGLEKDHNDLIPTSCPNNQHHLEPPPPPSQHNQQQHQQHHHHHQQQQHHHHHHQVDSIEQQNQYDLENLREHLGANWATLVDEHWPSSSLITTTTTGIEAGLIQNSTNNNNNINDNISQFLCIFEEKYKLYYKRMVELLNMLKFSEVEHLWREFWQPLNDNDAVESERKKEQHQDWPIDSNEVANNHQHCSSTDSATIETSSHMNGLQQQQLNNNNSDITHHQQSMHIDYEQQQQQRQQQHAIFELNFHQLYELTSHEQVIDRINQIDYSLYSAIESFLLPDILSPIPYLLAQQIRSFAINIGLWIKQSVKDYLPQFVNEKSKTARAFGYTLRRYTSLNHLATASRAIWDKQNSLSQLSIDLSRVDLRDIEHQVCLMTRNQNQKNNNNNTSINLIGSSTNGIVQLTPSISVNSTNTTGSTSHTINQQQTLTNINNNQHISLHQNENNLLNGNTNTGSMSANQQQHSTTSHLCAMQPGQLIQNFLHLLEDPCPANSWPDWCKNLVESRVCGSSIEEARNFVLEWNFYISLIMKELTLKSAPSYGSFQLIRLLFDEYIFYLVITSLAQAQNKTPAQLLSS